MEIDIACDARLSPLEQYNFLPTLSGEELGVDKVLAIFGRAEPLDFIDLFSIESKYGLEFLCRLAKEKDPGFSLDVFVQMLSSFGRFRRSEFDLDDSTFEELCDRINKWLKLITRPNFMNKSD